MWINNYVFELSYMGYEAVSIYRAEINLYNPFLIVDFDRGLDPPFTFHKSCR